MSAIPRKHVAVIGAGPCGLTAAKNALEAGFEVTLFEKADRVGGNWVFNSRTGHSSVYENTHIISSKLWSAYEDFPMPEHYPEYPKHDLLQAYFQAYAETFGVIRCIRFGAKVTKAEPTGEGQWRVRWQERRSKNTKQFDALFVANGHHSAPRWPEFEGSFSGKMLHSHDFKCVDESWRGKNILIVGAGNSACDIAVESARLAKSVHLSMRSPQWFVPKFIFGMPADVFSAQTRFLPKVVKQFSTKLILRLLQGRYSSYGLPQPWFPPLSQHPTVNSDLIDFVRHGRIRPRPQVRRLDGEVVEFCDGSREAFDIICCCTGFWMDTPFLDPSIADFRDQLKLRLFHKIFPETARNLYFIGFIQPLGCIWPLADHQARLACADVAGRWTRPADLKAAIDAEVAHPHFSYQGGLRHSSEVDYHSYRAEMRAELLRAGTDIGRPRAGAGSGFKAAKALAPAT